MVAGNGNRPGLLTGDCVSKLGCICAVEYYPAIGRDELVMCANTGTFPKSSAKQNKTKPSKNPTKDGLPYDSSRPEFRKDRSAVVESRPGFAWGWDGQGDWLQRGPKELSGAIEMFYRGDGGLHRCMYLSPLICTPQIGV